MMANEDIALKQILINRVATYGLLARLYRTEVDQLLLDQLRSMRFPASTGNASVDEAYHLLHAYLSQVWERALTELAIDFLRVFIGSGNDAYSAAYPFESVYTSEKRLLMDDAREMVRALYLSEGVTRKSSWKEGEDHISLELEFVQLLGERTVEAFESNDDAAAGRLIETQLAFIDGHLVNWVPIFAQDMKKFAKTDFYQALALLTEGFLETDREFLVDLLGDEDIGSEGNEA
ncbi:MAG: molecular chaperone TorD family protein [Coriobacteriaceae bacterium]|jgi:TorA maturation chaperone TorD|nr:molecular chaperone TorD family protein [Coriobacteriaceae bacterium]